MFDESSTETGSLGGVRTTWKDPTFSPGLLLAYVQSDEVSVDRCLVPLNEYLNVGRHSSNSALCVNETTVSSKHFRVLAEGGSSFIEDAGSRNGTFVNGERIGGVPVRLGGNSVIRIGQSVLVYCDRAAPLMIPPLDNLGMVGHFHVGPLIEELKSVAFSDRSVLLVGPTGAGKEVAAHALLRIWKAESKPFVAHNAARFSSDEEAAATLFGVAKKVFSDVDERPGLIEQAEGGTLFLDEFHNLPIRLQRTLLRVIEGNEFSRIGETTTRKIDVRFMFASNAPGPGYSLASDVLGRLRVVPIPPLTERRGDIPGLFDHFLQKQCRKMDLSFQSMKSLLGGDHYESMCLDGFREDNVRGIIDLVDKLTTRVKAGMTEEEAIVTTFSERFGEDVVNTRYSSSESMVVESRTHGGGDKTEMPPAMDNAYGSPKSTYEQNKAVIIGAYESTEGNISATVRELEAIGIQTNRHWLTIYLERWGVRRNKGSKK